MKHSLRVIALFLAALTLLTACTAPKDPPADTTDSSETTAASTTELATDAVDVPTRETYEDLSHNVPEIQGADGKSSTVTAKGELNAPDVVLSFDGESGLFAVSSNIASIHDTATCDQCGFTENSDYALLCHGVNSTSAGFMITLATPVPLTSVTGMTATFRTTKKASSSVIRIMAASCTTMATFHNECPTIGDATADYVTMDINLTEPDKLNDNDGNISSFQFYFRNKEGMDMFLKTLTINVNPEKLLVVEELDGNYFSRGDVTSAIATAIAERFEAANVGAEITVEVDQYRQNNTKMDGSILYNATATLNDGTSVTGSGKVVIPHVSGAWLDNTSGSFGSSHDNLGQWQETFDPSGMVLLTNNSISAKEGIATAEYALIPEDGDYTSDEVVWRAPHVLKMGEKSIDALFVNAWLDQQFLPAGNIGPLLLLCDLCQQIVKDFTNEDKVTVVPCVQSLFEILKNAFRVSKLDAEGRFIQIFQHIKIDCPTSAVDKAFHAVIGPFGQIVKFAWSGVENRSVMIWSLLAMASAGKPRWICLWAMRFPSGWTRGALGSMAS